MRPRVVLGFSGGVDSAVAAKLLGISGWDVRCVYLETGSGEADSARESAERMGLPLEVIDAREALEREVCAPFERAYLSGATPSPCVLCNRRVKLALLSEAADAMGARHIATGHYAAARMGALFRARPENDQSYMLCRLTPEQAGRLILPLGSYEKTQVRSIAEELRLPSAHKPDSMEICFIPDKDYVGWLSRRCTLPSEGNFVFHGQVVGRHEGIHCYTVGQRRSGLIDGRKVYISRIDPVSNSIELALWEELFKTEVTARDFNWLVEAPTAPIRASVRVRHTKWENPDCTVYPDGDMVRIVCDEPVRAPAAGQSAVLYNGEQLLGGGFITAG